MNLLSSLLGKLLLCNIVVNLVQSGPHERRLMEKIRQELAGFSRYERPVEYDSLPLKVELGLHMQQIIDVHEKDQIIYTNMWITMKWNDYKLRWNKTDYGNITKITIPSNLLWKPDILLYNSAADSFDASYQSGLIVEHTGAIQQIPPGMFKSTCHINIRWFPFDTQACTLKFGSWTYDGTKIDLRFLDGIEEGYQEEFKPNGEWDLMGIPAVRNVETYECCPQEPYVDLTYTIQLKRRKLYYLVNIIGPCVLFAFLGLFTFCLPPDAGEKISFSVTVLLSLTVFMMIVSETLPATSEAIPLIALYFMCIMVMTAISVIATITALNYHHRNTDTHKMSKFVRVTICEWLAWILRMKRPGAKPQKISKNSWRKQSDLQMLNANASQSLLANVRNHDVENESFYSSFAASTPNIGATNDIKLDAHPLSVSNCTASTTVPSVTPSASNYNTLAASSQPSNARYELRAILRELRYLTMKQKEAEVDNKQNSDWKWCAMVLDRLFIWIVGILNTVIGVAVLFSAPGFFT